GQREGQGDGGDASSAGGEAAECALGCGGFRGGGAAGTCDTGGDDSFCRMSCPVACSAVIACAICSCRAPRSSTLRRRLARSWVIGPSCCTSSGRVAGVASDRVGGAGSSHSSAGAQI